METQLLLLKNKELSEIHYKNYVFFFGSYFQFFFFLTTEYLKVINLQLRPRKIECFYLSDKTIFSQFMVIYYSVDT